MLKKVCLYSLAVWIGGCIATSPFAALWPYYFVLDMLTSVAC